MVRDVVRSPWWSVAAALSLLGYRVARAIAGSGELAVWGIPWWAHVTVDFLSLLWLVGGPLGALRMARSFLFFGLLLPLLHTTLMVLVPRAQRSPGLVLLGAAVAAFLIGRLADLLRPISRGPLLDWSRQALLDRCDQRPSTDGAWDRVLPIMAASIGGLILIVTFHEASHRTIWFVLLLPDILYGLWAMASPAEPYVYVSRLAALPQAFEFCARSDNPALQPPPPIDFGPEKSYLSAKDFQ